MFTKSSVSACEVLVGLRRRERHRAAIVFFVCVCLKNINANAMAGDQQ
ncbi:unnamed protein product, partial [Rotaria sp. Silwood1]